MGDRLAVHINSLQSINWDAPPANPGTNDYMEVLVKETVTLHKLLSRYLPVPVVEVSTTLICGERSLRVALFSTSCQRFLPR
jgi:hypothetical protein